MKGGGSLGVRGRWGWGVNWGRGWVGGGGAR